MIDPSAKAINDTITSMADDTSPPLMTSHAKGHWFKSSTAHHVSAEVAERQTRYVQGVVSIRAWEFKSPLRHHALVAQLDRAQPCGG